MKKIVVVDDMHLDKEQEARLRSLGDVTIFKGVPDTKEEALKRIGDAEVAILGWTNLSRDMLDKLPKLKRIAVWATGYDYVDVQAATEKGIAVANVPGYAGEAVAELTFALMLAVLRDIPRADAHVRAGNYDWKQFKGSELRGKTLGVVGTGTIGSCVAGIGKCFGMQVIAFTAHPSEERAEKLGVEYVDLQTLLRESDIVTLHVPLSPETEGLIGETELGLMKPNAILINTARAKIVDQEALYRALAEGRIAGAGLDDILMPASKEHPLLQLSNAVFTPHIGFHTAEALKRKTDICLENVEGFVKGVPQNVVNPLSLQK